MDSNNNRMQSNEEHIQEILWIKARIIENLDERLEWLNKESKKIDDNIKLYTDPDLKYPELTNKGYMVLHDLDNIGEKVEQPHRDLISGNYSVTKLFLSYQSKVIPEIIGDTEDRIFLRDTLQKNDFHNKSKTEKLHFLIDCKHDSNLYDQLSTWNPFEWSNEIDDLIKIEKNPPPKKEKERLSAIQIAILLEGMGFFESKLWLTNKDRGDSSQKVMAALLGCKTTRTVRRLLLERGLKNQEGYKTNKKNLAHLLEGWIIP